MRILQIAEHQMPAKDADGTGRIVDWLCKGLSDIGQEVLIHGLKPGSISNYAKLCLEYPQADEFDIIHLHSWSPHGEHLKWVKYNKPYVASLHGAIHEPELKQRCLESSNLIYLSKFTAQYEGHSAFTKVPVVNNFVDSSEFLFSPEKENYFLIMAGTDWGNQKGFFRAISIAKQLGINLYIAGSGKNQSIIDEIKSHCNNKIKYLGSVNGIKKAELISKAKAFLLLSELPEACPVSFFEAIISGTPVISTYSGALSELNNSITGIRCNTDLQIKKAILYYQNLTNPQEYYTSVWTHAITTYSHLVGAQNYLKMYERMLKQGNLNA